MAAAVTAADHRRRRGGPPDDHDERGPLAEDVLAGLPRPAKSVITIERVLLILGFAGAFMQFVFGLGVNWHGTLATAEQVQQLNTTIKAEYLRRDVYDAQQKSISDTLERLNCTLEEFNREQRAAAADRRARGN